MRTISSSIGAAATTPIPPSAASGPTVRADRDPSFNPQAGKDPGPAIEAAVAENGKGSDHACP
jgi:hypothetical protein